MRQRLASDNPAVVQFQSDVGATLNNMALLDLDGERFSQARDRLLQAVKCQKLALASNPLDPTFRQFLQNHYTNLQEAAGVLRDASLATDARLGLAELAASDPRFAALDERMKAVVGGEIAMDAEELLILGQRAYDTARYALAARFFDEALERDAALAESRQLQYAYNGACSAALAGSGEGLNDPPPDESAQTKLRGKALTRLRGELERWTELLDSSVEEDRQIVARTLSHWQTDFDLSGVRDDAALANRPESERANWQALWRQVEELRSRAATASSRREESCMPRDETARTILRGQALA
jgi:tetratricopeptide (TPR) repeat protein